MEWGKEKTIELINEMHIHPAIWDVTSRDYKDKNKRRDSFDEMAAKFLCSREDVERKTANLRSQYSREHHKVIKSKCSGSGADDVYVSKWFGYNLLGFTKQGNVPNKTRNNYSGSIATDSINISNVDDEAITESPFTTESPQFLLDELTASDSFAQTPEPQPKKKRFVKRSTEDTFLNEAIQTLKVVKERKADKNQQDASFSRNIERNRDEFDMFGDSIASQLRNVKNALARSRAKFNIQKVLFEAETGEYDAVVVQYEPIPSAIDTWIRDVSVSQTSNSSQDLSQDRLEQNVDDEV